MKILALDLGPIGGNGEGLGPFGDLGTKATKTSGLAGVISAVNSVVGIMTIFASIWFLFQILYSGYEWISAGGDSKKIATSRDRITHSFIGLVIVIGAWSLLAIAGQFFGYDTLIDPTKVIDQMGIK